MLKIRKFQKKDTKEVANLIQKTYEKFCIKDATKEANKRYLSRFDTNKENLHKLESEFLRTKIAFVASIDDKIVGIARGGKERMRNLFVDSKYQRKGIAKKLTKKYEAKVKKLGCSKLKVAASLYAVPFYLSRGYKKSTGIRKFKGIKMQPMKKTLK